jgi:hypothetical protein
VRGDPLERTLFGSKSAETTHGTIWQHYLHSPHTAFSNGRHPKMRAARTLYSSRRPTTSPPGAVHPPPLPLGQRRLPTLAQCGGRNLALSGQRVDFARQAIFEGESAIGGQVAQAKMFGGIFAAPPLPAAALTGFTYSGGIARVPVSVLCGQCASSRLIEFPGQSRSGKALQPALRRTDIGCATAARCGMCESHAHPLLAQVSPQLAPKLITRFVVWTLGHMQATGNPVTVQKAQMSGLCCTDTSGNRYLSLDVWPARQARNAAAACSRVTDSIGPWFRARFINPATSLC